ncbi:MAG: AAA family ATPase [Polyangiaceae bacterium]
MSGLRLDEGGCPKLCSAAVLLALRVRNFILMDALELRLSPGFNVLTGETGAGKSIVVGALSLVLGGRASAEQVRPGESEAEIEALFDQRDHGGQHLIRGRLSGLTVGSWARGGCRVGSRNGGENVGLRLDEVVVPNYVPPPCCWHFGFGISS